MTGTRKAFHEEITEMEDDVIRMGAMVIEAIGGAASSLLDGDLQAVERVIENDKAIDDLTHSIEERCYLLLARQQPMAIDLRTIVGVLRVIHELERAGDNMKSVAKASRRLYPHGLEPKMRGLIDRMRDQATVQMRLAIDAFADRDPVRATALEDMDDVMDDLQKDLFRTIFAAAAIDDVSIHRAVQVTLIGRFFERTADHAVNIGDRVAYMVTGRFPEGPKGPAHLSGNGAQGSNGERAADAPSS
ncbi:MAG: phosphate signaling complex protein PhoU [Acidimicrobiales bacterium]